ncbi:hypothetical protein A9Q81_12345 [Gammaproteobacteria bacterium 42_54_T18]|nr:hypothetical protein A9Q81_12345 [Gammaproteobacteria bacterium 42_54_T18]
METEDLEKQHIGSDVPERVSPVSQIASAPILQRKGMSTFSKLVVTLSLLCALGAGGGVAWLWVTDQQQQLQQQLAQQNIENTLKEQRRQITGLTTQLTQLSAGDIKRQNLLGVVKKSTAMLQGRLASVESQMTELTGAHRVDWMLKEAEHFVIVAERRLSLLSDINGSLALLTEADNLVKDMQEPATRTLREALTKDLMALREASSKHVDSEGIFTRIELLMSKIEGLEKAALIFKADEEALVADERVEIATIEENGGWSRFVGRLVGFVESLVRVRVNDETTIKPMLLADQQEYLQQNIFVLLEQAQLSLLRTDYVGFKVSLKQADKRIEQYLRTDTPEAKFVLEELRALADTPMVTVVPSIERSVTALQVFRDYWQQEKVERQLQKNQLEEFVSPSIKTNSDR